MNVPKEILVSLNTNENAFLEYVKKVFALDLYKNKNIPLEYCAKLAEMAKEDFTVFLSENKGSIEISTDPFYSQTLNWKHE